VSDFTDLLDMYDIKPGYGDIDTLLDRVQSDNIHGLIDEYNNGWVDNEELFKIIEEECYDLDELISLGLDYEED